MDWKAIARTVEDLSVEGGRRTVEEVWRCVQRGLVYPAPYAIFVTLFQRERPAAPMTKARLGQVLASAREQIHKNFPDAHTTAILGVGFDLWHQMSVADGTQLPVGMALAFREGDDKDEGNSEPLLHSAVSTRSGSAFLDSKADLWSHIKSDKQEHCEGVLAWLRRRMEVTEAWADGEKTKSQHAATKSNRTDKRGGKVLGSRFSREPEQRHRPPHHPATDHRGL